MQELLLLLPVRRYRTKYVKGFGRPYSAFERLVLRAVKDGAESIADLSEIFHIHRRLLVESIITLTQARLVSIVVEANAEFRITPAGTRCIQGSLADDEIMKTEPDTTDFVLESVRGGIARADDVYYWDQRQLEERGFWNYHAIVPSSCVPNTLPPSLVQNLLTVGPNEWIHGVGETQVVRPSGIWLPVILNLSNETLQGVPHAWKDPLVSKLLPLARNQNIGVSLSATKVQADTANTRANIQVRVVAEDGPSTEQPQGMPLSISSDDFFTDDLSHSSYLAHALETAKRSIYIASAFITTECLSAWRERIIGALRRGVTIDLSGPYNDLAREPAEVLRGIFTESRAHDCPGDFTFSPMASDSHAKLLIFDFDGTIEACIGSFNWLSRSRPDPTHSLTSSSSVRDISVRVRGCSVVASLCQVAAALLARSLISGTTPRQVIRWTNYANDLRRKARAESAEYNCTARLVSDVQHEALLSDQLRKAHRRIVVTSHQLGYVAHERLIPARSKLRDEGFTYHAIYAETTDSADIENLRELVHSCGGKLLHHPDVHGKVLIADDLLCISSYNFLSADAHDAFTGTRELGIVIDGEQPTADLLSKIALLTRT